MVLSMAIGSSLGSLVALIAREVMRRPTPSWIRALDINLYISRSLINANALGIAVAVALASIPIGRMIVRRRWRLSFARLRTLAEAVSANVKLAVRDRGED
jgi:hypothetical protein